MLKIRTPRNLNNETSVEDPTFSEALNPPSDGIAKPLASLKAPSTSMYISDDDFLLSIFEEDTPRPSSSNLEPSGNVFKEPYPVVRSSVKTSYQSNSSSGFDQDSNKNRNKKYGGNTVKRNEHKILSTEEDYKEDDITLHMEVDQEGSDNEQAILPENTPGKKRRRSGKPRRPRTLKEDVPLAERLKNRLVTRRNKRRKEKSQGDVNPETEPWSEEEKLNFVTGLRKVGHFNFDLLQTYVPTRSTAQVKKFFWYHKASFKAKQSYKKIYKLNTSYIMRRTSVDNMDVAVSFRRNRTNTETPLFSNGEYGPWWSCFLTEIERQTEPEYLRDRSNLIRRIHKRHALGHALFMIREFEEHPSVEETGGVDLKLAYHFLWACFTQQPLPEVDPITRSFLTNQYEMLVNSSLTNTKVVTFMDNFKRNIDDYTIQDPLISQHPDRETHFTHKAKDRSHPIPTVLPSRSNSQSEESPDPEQWVGSRRGWFAKYCSLKKQSYQDALFLFKHSLNENEPLENQAGLSAELLKNSVLNPLSIPMDILKK